VRRERTVAPLPLGAAFIDAIKVFS